MTAMTPRGMPGCSEKPSHTVWGFGVCFFFARGGGGGREAARVAIFSAAARQPDK